MLRRGRSVIAYGLVAALKYAAILQKKIIIFCKVQHVFLPW